ncbi:MAG: hypothetical protein EP343_11205 [Deltaproteobacteria bacterium]|nr:MAG: hypothetical protein EP343_11205 [Deltaproteobacteria bacterium]
MSSSTSQPNAMTSPTTGQESSTRADAHHWIRLALAGVLGPLGFLHWAWQRDTQKARGQALALTLLWLAQAAMAWWWLPPRLLQTKGYIVLVPLTANGIAMAWLLAAAFWPREPEENRGTYLLGHALHILALEAWLIALNGLHASPFAMTLRISTPLVLGVMWTLLWQEMAPGISLNERARKAHVRQWLGWFLALSMSGVAFLLFQLVATLQRR